MDKLVRYIEWRRKKYGHVECRVSPSSMYYNIGDVRIRISDHMKYSESCIGDIDYYFIIQSGDRYIFISNPKYNKDGKMYMNTIEYASAKEFIKSIHEYVIRYASVSEWYRPEGWNRNNIESACGKSESDTDWRLPLDTFIKTYLDTGNPNRTVSVINKFESIVYGCPQKGDISKKIFNFSRVYGNMSRPQYETLMEKIEEGR